MRLGIIAVLLALSLAGCGDEKSPKIDPGAGPVTLVSGPAAGGPDATATLTRIDTPERLDAFAGLFRDPFAQQIKAAAEKVKVGKGQVLAAAKVSEGCFGAKSAKASGNELVGVPDPQEGKVQCITSITTVGLLAAPEAGLAPAS